MADDAFFSAFVIILCIDGLLLLGQVAVHDINPAANFTFIHDTDMPHAQVMQNGTYVMNSSMNGMLPKMSQGVDSDSGLSFIDPIITAKNWLVDFVKTIVSILAGPYFFLSAILPGNYQAFAFAVGFIWFISTMLLVIKFMLGR